MSRQRIAGYVVSRIIFHKSNYAYLLKSLLSGDAGKGYFARPPIRAKVIGNLMGIESWHRILFGRPCRDYKTSYLLACIAAAYDNAIDEEQYRDWRELDHLLATIPPTGERDEWSSAIGAARSTWIGLHRHNPSCCNRALPYFKGILHATEEGFRQATKDPVDEEKLRASIYEKGGFSFVLFSIVEDPELAAHLLETAYMFGAASQIADDIYDREEDLSLGQATLASRNLIREADRDLIDEAIARLPRHEGIISRMLLEAWTIHLTDSLRLYDSGGTRGGWRYDIGQTVFRLGIRFLPGIPRRLLRRS